MRVTIHYEAGDIPYDIDPANLSKLLEHAERLSEKKNAEYSGFLVLKCDSCGKIRAFCTRQELKENECACGHKTPLSGQMRQAVMKCSSCGKQFYYHTNISDETFELECLACGHKNIMRLNESRNEYMTEPSEGGEPIDR